MERMNESDLCVHLVDIDGTVTAHCRNQPDSSHSSARPVSCWLANRLSFPKRIKDCLSCLDIKDLCTLGIFFCLFFEKNNCFVTF